MAAEAGKVDVALSRLVAEDRGRLLAALIGQLGDFQLAEDSLQDACASALVHWHRSGVPNAPAGWILTVARRKAIDRLRRASRAAAGNCDYDYLLKLDQSEPAEAPDIPDDRLRLIFTCCHPALEPKSRIALTLRTLGGLSTPEIARAFLDKEATMGQRLTRARAKIRAARIPYEVPGPEFWTERLGSVLDVIYLVFNEGYRTGCGDLLRVDLCDEAIHLARMLDALRPDQPEIEGLLALLLLTHARRSARIDGTGRMVPLEAQDRGLWDAAMIAEGTDLLDRAMARGLTGPNQIKAAIAALHSAAPDHSATDFRQIFLLYDALTRMEPTPVVRLNRAVALADADGLSAALIELRGLGAELSGYQPYFAAHAELLARDGQADEARSSYDRAIELSGNDAEREFLRVRRGQVS